jgi:hypothetical protein
MYPSGYSVIQNLKYCIFRKNINLKKTTCTIQYPETFFFTTVQFKTKALLTIISKLCGSVLSATLMTIGLCLVKLCFRTRAATLLWSQCRSLIVEPEPHSYCGARAATLFWSQSRILIVVPEPQPYCGARAVFLLWSQSRNLIVELEPHCITVPVPTTTTDR